MNDDSSHLAGSARPRNFATTQWSVVLAAREKGSRDCQLALAQLCEAYWYPLYSYVRRRTGDVHQAQDLTQAFFFHLLEQQAIAKADPERGRFRAFLLAALKNFLANENDKQRAAKRGGGRADLSLDFDAGESRYQIEPAHELTPDKLFERRWVLTLLDQVLEQLKAELVAVGKSAEFDELKGALTDQATAEDYERAAGKLGITPAAARQSAYRLRKRYRELFRQEVARTVADEGEIDDEIGRLLKALAP